MTSKPILMQWLIALGFALALSACGGNATVPENHFYRLEVPAPTFKAAKALDGVLEVDRLLATGSLSQRSIVYRQTDNPHQLKAYHYHFWNEAPGELLQAELVGYLRAVGIAEKVMTPEMRARPTHAVTGRVVKLERIVGGAPAAAIEMNLVLRRVADNHVLVSKTYARDVTPKDDTLTALVQALSLAAGDIFKTFAEDVARAR